MTPHFKLSEFATRDEANGPSYVPTDPQILASLKKLAENLEVLRTELGNVPIIIQSGWRSKAHNTRVGGAADSQHLYGRAADITVPGVTPGVVTDTIQRLIKQGKMTQGGLHAYPHYGFTHYDVRGHEARW